MKRPIDVRREAGGHFNVDADAGNIVAMTGLGDRMLIVAERAIFSVRMADQIDPQRLNIGVPPVVQQRLLEHGARSEVVGKTLLTAMELFNPTHLPAAFPAEEAIGRTFEAARQLSEVADAADLLAAREAETRALIDAGQLELARLPRTPNLRGQCVHAVGQARAAVLELVWIAQCFYPKARPNDPWRESLTAALTAALHPDDGFLAALPQIVADLHRVENIRHAAEHPDQHKSLIVTDYELMPDLQLVAPTIELRHRQTPMQRQDAVQFLRTLAAGVANTFEAMIATLCDRNTREYGIFVSFVVDLEADRRNGSRFSWQSTLREGALFPPPAPVEAP